MVSLQRLFLKGSLVLIGLVVAVVFFPIAFNVMPAPFFDRGCAVSQSLGTNIACYGFMWNTITIGVFIGIIGPALGIFLVHREMALIGETLAHAAFAGVALGTLLFAASGWDSRLLVTALVIAVFGAVAIQYLKEKTGSYGDVPIAIILTGSFAIGTLLIDIGGGFAFVDINSYLFGNISITDDRSVVIMAILSLIVIGVITVAYKPLLYITFDEQIARVGDVPVSTLNGILIVLTALVVVGAMQIMGVILVAAMLVVPVAAASQVVSGFREAMYASIVFGVLSVSIGLGISWGYSLRPGATIVVVAIGVYLLAIMFSTQ